MQRFIVLSRQSSLQSRASIGYPNACRADELLGEDLCSRVGSGWIAYRKSSDCWNEDRNPHV
ncbi:MAG: hypothetical protein AAFU85_23880, partial [Planctomycetota bacterium]